MSEMSYDDALSALQEAATAEATADAEASAELLGQASREPSTPSEAAETVTPAAPVPAQEDSFVSRADLDSLLDGVTDPAARERIETAYKSFQGDYTRKTQALAEKSKVYDEFGDPNAVRQALEFQQALQDPQNWPQIHQELTTALQQIGYTPAQAAAEASAQMGQVPAQTAPARPSLDNLDDPDMEPVRDYLENLEERFSAFTDQVEAERAQAREEQQRLAIVGELTRQENAIRQANPGLTDEDMNAVYEMSSFFGGNLFQAKERLDTLKQKWLQGYVDGKGSVQDTPGIQPIPGAGVASDPVVTAADLSDKEIDALAQRVIDESGALSTF